MTRSNSSGPGNNSRPFFHLLVEAGRPELHTPSGAMESAIVEALEERGPGQKLTGEELAEAAGYPYHGRFREVLARLTKAGTIKNQRPGYTVPSRS